MFKSPATKSLKSDAFLKKTLKLNNKDIIGSGGHGIVYKLALSDSMTFAVKRLNRGSAERDQGFERELEAMGDIKHRNIVTLYGYYTAPHYNLLVYELMPNGSLYAYLHGMCVYIYIKNFSFSKLLNDDMIHYSVLNLMIVQEDQMRRFWIGHHGIK